MPPDDPSKLPPAIPELSDSTKKGGDTPKQQETRTTLGSEAFLPPSPLMVLAMAAIGQLPGKGLSDAEVKTMLGNRNDRFHASEMLRQKDGAGWSSSTSAQDKNSLWNAEYSGLVQAAQTGWRVGGAQTLDDRGVEVFSKTSPALAARFLALRTLHQKNIADISSKLGIKLSAEETALLNSPGEPGNNAVATKRFELLNTLEAHFSKFLQDPNWKPGKITEPTFLDNLAKSIKGNPGLAGTRTVEAATAATPTRQAEAAATSEQEKAASDTNKTAKSGSVVHVAKAATRGGDVSKKDEAKSTSESTSSKTDDLNKKSQAQIAQDLIAKITLPTGTAKGLVDARQPLIDKLTEFGKGTDPAVTEKLRKLLREVGSSRMDSDTLVTELSNQFGLGKEDRKDDPKVAFTALIESLKTHIGSGANNNDLRTALDELAKKGPVDPVLAQHLQGLNDSFGTTQKGGPGGQPVEVNQAVVEQALRNVLIQKQSWPQWLDEKAQNLADAGAWMWNHKIATGVGAVATIVAGRIIYRTANALSEPDTYIKAGKVVGGAALRLAGKKLSERAEQRRNAGVETPTEARKNLAEDLFETSISEGAGDSGGIVTTRGALVLLRDMQAGYAEDPETAAKEGPRVRAVNSLIRTLAAVESEGKGDLSPAAAMRKWAGLPAVAVVAGDTAAAPVTPGPGGASTTGEASTGAAPSTPELPTIAPAGRSAADAFLFLTDAPPGSTASRSTSPDAETSPAAESTPFGRRLASFIRLGRGGSSDRSGAPDSTASSATGDSDIIGFADEPSGIFIVEAPAPINPLNTSSGAEATARPVEVSLTDLVSLQQLASAGTGAGIRDHDLYKSIEVEFARQLKDAEGKPDEIRRITAEQTAFQKNPRTYLDECKSVLDKEAGGRGDLGKVMKAAGTTAAILLLIDLATKNRHETPLDRANAARDRSSN